MTAKPEAERENAKVPGRQIPGPRPLPLHLAVSSSVWMTSLGALPFLKSDSLPWRPELRGQAQALVHALANVNPDAFAAAVEAEAHRRLGAFADGIQRYNVAETAERARTDRFDAAAEVWRQGSTRVLDFGVTNKAAAKGRPVLVVPSLINRATVLDLQPGRSLMRALAATGLRPFLVDWDMPGDEEAAFTLSDYIAGRLAAALDAVTELVGGPVAVVGYCMGGNLILPLPMFAPDKVSAMALLATPWDFDAMAEVPVRMLKATRQRFEDLIDSQGRLPVDVLQAMFASLDPYLALRKFTRFARLDGDGDEALHFIALEDWLNDGVPLVGPVARECLFDWYGRNTPGRGQWRVAGDVVDPRRVTCPTLLVVPRQDTIVPPQSALPLAALLAKAETAVQPAGHIGMVAGHNGPERLYPLLAEWLLRQPA